MEWAIVECSPDQVRSIIAQHQLSHDRSDVRQQIGEITLRPHQTSAVERIVRAIDEFGGALLCDEVGLGKTYVALSVARQCSGIVVVAPAVLRSMWSTASRRACVPVHFVSFESLSRRASGEHCDFLIVDEAHHARNPGTRRYAELQRLARNRPVLLLSATPIHNRSKDLTSLFALFLGSRAEALHPEEVARCVIRRTVEAAADFLAYPHIAETVWLTSAADPLMAEKLRRLPPPIPPREAGDANTLVVRSLIRQWASSDDALRGALRRRIRRASALAAALEEGSYPSEVELQSWVQGDDDVQLGFTPLLAPPASDAQQLLTAIHRHDDALRSLITAVPQGSPRTHATADIIRSIRRNHPNERIVAFSQYADTIAGLYRRLRSDPYIAALSGKGATIASGRITQDDALRRFAPVGYGASSIRAIERIELLLATDLLSEGVNLQDASVVVHLDMPWTPARVEQRLGRAARMGSHHSVVKCYALAPPEAAEQLLGLSATLERKARLVERELGVKKPHADPSVPEAVEAIRAELAEWISNGTHMAGQPGGVRTASVEGHSDGFIALRDSSNGAELVVEDEEGVSTDPRRVLTAVRRARGRPAQFSISRVHHALRRLDAHFQRIAALSPADLMFSTKARRAALRRIAKVQAAVSGHVRLARLSAIESARRIVSGPMDAASEAALEKLLNESVDDVQFIERVRALPSRRASRSAPRRSESRRCRTIALLVFVRA